MKTDDNPADYISSGLPVVQLIKQEQWWYGPAWLLEDSIKTDEQQNTDDLSTIPEFRSTPDVVMMNAESEFSDILSTFSSLKHLQRVIAYCFRFAMNAKSPKRYCICISSRMSVHQVDDETSFISNIHFKYLYAGPQALLGFMRQNYRPLNGIYLA